MQADIAKHQAEVAKAIKIHRANEKLQQEVKDFKAKVEKLKIDKDALETEVQELQMKTNQSVSRDLP